MKVVLLFMLHVALSSCCSRGSQEAAPPPPDRLALLIVLDKSGIMAGDAIEKMKEACIASAKVVSDRGVIGVIAFDVRPRWILPFTEGSKQDCIESNMKRLYADGGTQIYPALAEALRAFQNFPEVKSCHPKHVILCSDGMTQPEDFRTMVGRRMADEGISLSTVCISRGDGFDAPLMSRIAEWGGGRFFFTEDPKKLPGLFASEANRLIVPRAGPKGLDEATKLLAEADRLWETDSESAIKLYKRLLADYGDAVSALKARTKIEKRAQQGDQ